MLRVFGRLPVSGVTGCSEAGVRKASGEETAPRSIDLVESGPSSLLRLSLMTQSGALMFELLAAEQAITVQGAVVAYAPPFTLAAPRVKRGRG